MNTFLEPLSQEEEEHYLELLKNGDKEAKDILITRNLRLVAHVAKKYYSDNRDSEELISIGIIGLIKAINTFKGDKGNKLGTYASKCIENEILMMLRNEKKKSKEVSLLEPIGVDKEGNTISLLDVLENDGLSPDEKFQKKEDEIRLIKYVNSVLTERERDIIIKRYGLNNKKPMTQSKIGKKYNISRSYVSRIEKQAIQKLKKAFE